MEHKKNDVKVVDKITENVIANSKFYEGMVKDLAEYRKDYQERLELLKEIPE